MILLEYIHFDLAEQRSSSLFGLSLCLHLNRRSVDGLPYQLGIICFSRTKLMRSSSFARMIS